MPGRTTSDLPNSFRQILIAQWRGMRIETRKLFELHGGSAKNEAASGVAFLFCRFAAADAGDTVLVFKHGHVRESDRVLFEMERRVNALAHGQPKPRSRADIMVEPIFRFMILPDARPAPISRWRRCPLAVQQSCRGDGISRNVFLAAD